MTQENALNTNIFLSNGEILNTIEMWNLFSTAQVEVFELGVIFVKICDLCIPNNFAAKKV